MRGERGGGGGPLVVKIGGRALATPGASGELASELALLRARGPVLVVHGGGAEVDAWCRRLGLAPRFAGGLRVTDEATLEVVVAVLAGLANQRLVATLRGAGVDAVGLTGADGGLAEVCARDETRLGRVARVRSVRPALLEELLAAGRTPVVASIAATRASLWNVNADELAAHVAAAVEAPALVLLSDVPGLRLGGRVVERLIPAEIEDALARSEVGGGMVPKLRAAAVALEGGAGRVLLGAWPGPGGLTRLLDGASPCTEIAHGSAAGTLA